MFYFNAERMRSLPVIPVPMWSCVTTGRSYGTRLQSLRARAWWTSPTSLLTGSSATLPSAHGPTMATRYVKAGEWMKEYHTQQSWLNNSHKGWLMHYTAAIDLRNLLSTWCWYLKFNQQCCVLIIVTTNKNIHRYTFFIAYIVHNVGYRGFVTNWLLTSEKKVYNGLTHSDLD